MGAQHGNCIQQGDLFYSAGLHRNHSQHKEKKNTKKLGQVFEKSAGELTRRVEVNKEEILGSKLSMYGNTLTYSRL